MTFVHKEHVQIGRGGKRLNASLTSPVVQNEKSYILHKVARGTAKKKKKTAAAEVKIQECAEEDIEKRKKKIEEWDAEGIEEMPKKKKTAMKKKTAKKKKTAAAEVKIQECSEEDIEKRKKKIEEWDAEEIDEMPKYWMDYKDWCPPDFLLGDLSEELSPIPQSSSQSSETSLDVEDVFKTEHESEVVLSPRPPCPKSIFGDGDHFPFDYEDLCFKYGLSFPELKKEYDELVEDPHSSGRDDQAFPPQL